MGRRTYSEMLRSLVELRNQQFRDDPQREEARIHMLEMLMQEILESLRDKFDPI